MIQPMLYIIFDRETSATLGATPFIAEATAALATARSAGTAADWRQTFPRKDR